VRRVVLAAGDKDAAAGLHERPSPSRTDAAGLPTRFVSLGPGGHELPSDTDARMCDAVAWVREADPAACRP